LKRKVGYTVTVKTTSLLG